ncbi:MAG: hypothetical protein K6F50_06215 [Kiritimatiellae bacterium]|nr:hypothetical protein [Kiritimatiellia bacterium]
MYKRSYSYVMPEETRAFNAEVEALALKLAPSDLRERYTEAKLVDKELGDWINMLPALGYRPDRGDDGIYLKPRNPPSRFGLAIEAIVRYFTNSPLTLLLLGLGILLGGSVICEYFMATQGRGTDAYFPYMRATELSGLGLWAFFLARCLDLKSIFGVDYYEYQPRILKLWWLLSFITASLTCMLTLSLVWDFELTYIKQNPALFFWRSDMVTATLATNSTTYTLIKVFFSLTAALSAFAVREEMKRESVIRHRSGRLDFATTERMWVYEDRADDILSGREGPHPEYLAYKERQAAQKKKDEKEAGAENKAEKK